jgi:uncharacterized membrane protein
MTTQTLASVYMQMDAADWFLMALGLLVFAALLLWLGASLAGEKHTPGQGPSEESSTLHLLDRRLARGEITAEEHDEVRRVLAGDHPPSSGTESEMSDVLA